MGDRTGISWTDATWNPQLGCSRISRGCQHCYAERQSAGRLRNSPAYEGLTRNGRFTGRINLLPERLDQPLRWARPRRIFVNSMSDLFHHRVEPEWIARVVAVMSLAEWHVFQALTKRPERMAALLADADFVAMVRAAREDYADHPKVRGRLGVLVPEAMPWPLPNVWWGTSIENGAHVGRADFLRLTPATVRWVSAEPLVGDLAGLSLEGVDWVVVGGESGPGADPMQPRWARSLRDRCKSAGVAFHFKQWGQLEPLPIIGPAEGDDIRRVIMPDGELKPLRIRRPGRSGTMRNSTSGELRPGEETRGGLVMVDEQTVFLRRRSKEEAGRILDGVVHDAYPEP